jgi:hypothetical protein
MSKLFIIKRSRSLRDQDLAGKARKRKEKVKKEKKK